MANAVSHSCVVSTWLIDYCVSIEGKDALIQKTDECAQLIFKMIGSCQYDLEIPVVLKEKLTKLKKDYEDKYNKIWIGHYKEVFNIEELSFFSWMTAISFYEDQMKIFIKEHPMPLQLTNFLSLKGSLDDFGDNFKNIKAPLEEEINNLRLIINFLDFSKGEVKLPSTISIQNFTHFLFSKAAICYQDHGAKSKNEEEDSKMSTIHLTEPYFISWIKVMIEWGLETTESNYIQMCQVLKSLNISIIPEKVKKVESSSEEYPFLDYLINKSYEKLLFTLEIPKLPPCLEKLLKSYFKKREFERKMVLMGYLPEFRITNEWKKIIASRAEIQYLERFLELFQLLDKKLDLAISTFDHLLTEQEFSRIKNKFKTFQVDSQQLSLMENRYLNEVNQALKTLQLQLIHSIADFEWIEKSMIKQPNQTKNFYETIGKANWQNAEEAYQTLQNVAAANPQLSEYARIFYEQGEEKWRFVKEVLVGHAIRSFKNAASNSDARQVINENIEERKYGSHYLQSTTNETL